jgi:6-phospho-3-hexuloisomerase
MRNSMNLILAEISLAASNTEPSGYPEFLDLFSKDNSRIICIGAGRVGLAMRGFTMRLGHLGLNAYFLGDSTVPKTGPGDLLLVGSGSGSTPSILSIVKIAKDKGLKIGLVTATTNSPMGEIATAKVVLKTPSKNSVNDPQPSAQPMTTLFEQTLSIFLDAAVLDLMVKFHETSDTMSRRHNVIE